MDKIKILIVDDEYLERALIKFSIDWDKLNFEIMGEASSGDEALEIINSHSPDIVFTDVCMPFMDGLELAKIIQKDFKGIKVVIITGHRDFEYAKAGIKYGVEEFLLKPINSSDIMKICINLKEKIEDEKMFMREIEDMRNQLFKKIHLTEEDKALEGFSRTRELALKASEIIEENLSDINLSLGMIADKLYVNKSYLSRIFKQETGENITDCIMRLRIQKSTYYLKNTDFLAYEIGEKVGIPDPNYFSTCFKKYTGESISEYRKKRR